MKLEWRHTVNNEYLAEEFVIYFANDRWTLQYTDYWTVPEHFVFVNMHNKGLNAVEVLKAFAQIVYDNSLNNKG